MNPTELSAKMTALVSRAAAGAARGSRLLGRILFFSLADERLAPGRCLSVHLDRGEITVVYGTRFLSRMKIAGIRHYPLEAGNYPAPEVLASTLALARSDLAATKADITLVVPKAWTILKTAEFPRVVKENLADVVSYELDRLTPLAADQAYYDYQITGEDEQRLMIVLAALKAETLAPYLQALRQRGIEVKRVIVGLSALGALCHSVQGGRTTLFLGLRPEGFEGGLLDEGRLRASFAEDFSPGGDEEKARTVAGAVMPLVEALQQEGRTPAVVAAGDAGAWPALAAHISAPLRFLAGTDLRLTARPPAKIVPSPALGGVLESLRTELRGPNLLAKGRTPPVRLPVAATITLIALLAALGVFSLAASLRLETKKVVAVEQEIAVRDREVRRLEAVKREAATLEKEIGAIEHFKTARPRVLNLLKELTELLSANAWLARIRSTDTSVMIEGYAASATEILAKLEASPYFRKVEFSSPTFRDARMKADRFAIKMELEGLPKEEKHRETP